MRPTLISLALAALIVLTPVVAPHASADDRDEQEARALAVRFMERLRDADDFGTLMKEFFPEDFAARVRAAVRETSAEDEFFFVCDRAVLLRATDADLRRTYVALMNFLSQQDRLADAAWVRVQLEEKMGGADSDGGGDPWARYLRLAADSIPEEAFRIAETDPLLKTALDPELVRTAAERLGAEGTEPADAEAEAKAAAGEEAEGEAAAERARAAAVRDLPRLRALTEKLERLAALLRGAAAKLRAQTESLAAAYSVSAESLGKGLFDRELNVYKLESETLETPALGLPAGSVLIRARIYPYEMAVARVGGRLTILAAYPDFDGD